MSPITSNPLSTQLRFANTLPGERADPERFGSISAAATEPGGVRALPWPLDPAPRDPATASSAAEPPGAGGSIETLMTAFFNALSSMIAQLGGLLQGAGSAPGGAGTGRGQTFFKDASANSVGDPHESFSGTTASGARVSSRWDSMRGHDDLLNSDSFRGGYRVSTAVTAQHGGATANERAAVTMDGGTTSASLAADGSYTAVSRGRSLTLDAGHAADLGDGATVTLNADRSLTIEDRNAGGGEIRTTLAINATGGIDVANEAHAVDLGGYLVQRTDEAASPPEAQRDADAEPPLEQPAALPQGGPKLA